MKKFLAIFLGVTIFGSGGIETKDAAVSSDICEVESKADNDSSTFYMQNNAQPFISPDQEAVELQIGRPQVSAAGAVLMDAATGKLLYAKNINSPYPPASTTKIMTALLVLENCKMDEVVTVGTKPPKAEGNTIMLIEGEQFTVKDMLNALIIESANDSAEVLAEHISGSVQNFAKVMNDRAKALGCRNTNFMNPSGLYDKYHKTTAYDLALIMKELIKYPEFKAIATTIDYTIPSTNKTPRERLIQNHNKLVIKNSGFYYEGCDGGKTGYTIQSQHSYVAAATREGRQLIVALIYDEDKKFYTDTAKLFDYGFGLTGN